MSTRIRPLVLSAQFACAMAAWFAGATAVATADIEIETRAGEPASTTGRVTDVDRSVDRAALFLGEFAVGGPAESPYRAARGVSHCARACDGSDAKTCHGFWCEDEVFEEEDVATSHESTPATDQAVNEIKVVVRQTRTGELTTAAETANQRPPAVTLRPGEAADEILKLRRAVGVNPIAGTIFDATEGDASAWAGDARPDQPPGSLSSEQSLAETIRRLETDDSANSGHASTEYDRWPSAETFGDSNCHLLRPAEQALEEAAALLEELGQYERSDAARELARQVREQARQRERIAQPARIWSQTIAN